MANEGEGTPTSTNQNKSPGGDRKTSCMPENPFLPDSLFGSNNDKIKAHVGLFIALVVGLRLVGMLTDPSSTLKRRKI